MRVLYLITHKKGAMGLCTTNYFYFSIVASAKQQGRADCLTSPKSTPLELEATVKQFKIPYVPIIDISVDKRAFTMLVDLQKSFHWVLPTLQYETMEDLLDEENLKNYIIDPVNKKREELRQAKNAEPETILIKKKVANPIPVL